MVKYSLLGIGNVQHILTWYYMMAIRRKLTVLQNPVQALRLFSSPPGDFAIAELRRNHPQMMVVSLMKLFRHVDISIHRMKRLDESRLHALQALELQCGRERPFKNAPRTLDLDIIFYGDVSLDTPELTLPHPRWQERAFVLQPLAEVWPERVSAVQLAGVKDQAIQRMA